MTAACVYSTAAYVVAAIVAINFGVSPKFGAVISATLSAVPGDITVVLHGMIGLLGAKIWREKDVDFGNPVNVTPAAAGIGVGVGDVQLSIGKFNWEGSRSAPSSRCRSTTSPTPSPPGNSGKPPTAPPRSTTRPALQ